MTYANRFVFCVSENAPDTTLEFFLEEPKLNPEGSVVEEVNISSVAKIMMSKKCAYLLLEVLKSSLSNTPKQESDAYER